MPALYDLQLTSMSRYKNWGSKDSGREPEIDYVYGAYIGMLWGRYEGREAAIIW